MDWTVGNLAYLALVVAAFFVFVGVVGYGSWRTSRPETKAEPQPMPEALPQAVVSPPEEALKVHGDKFSHSMDVAL